MLLSSAAPGVPGALSAPPVRGPGEAEGQPAWAGLSLWTAVYMGAGAAESEPPRNGRGEEEEEGRGGKGCGRCHVLLDLSRCPVEEEAVAGSPVKQD